MHPNNLKALTGIPENNTGLPADNGQIQMQEYQESTTLIANDGTELGEE
ncbi:hypothetical protein N9Z64_02445 [bacterium]|nr:hypothetical protein [bacterium]